MPAEGMSIVLANGTPLLTFNFSASPREIQGFLNGNTSFALFEKAGLILFLFKIDGFLDWSDLAFTIHLAGDESIEEGDSYLPFNLVLVDPVTKIVKGLRMVTVSPDFRSRLAELIRKQAAEPFYTMAYYQAIGSLYDQYPSASDLLKQAVIVNRVARHCQRCNDLITNTHCYKSPIGHTP